MRVPGLWSFGLPLTSPLYQEEYVRSRGVRATARSFGKLIKLKCLTGNDAKVKETPRKALLAPTSPGVRRGLSADVDERWWGRWENWIVTVDFAACISRRECSFNNSTTPGTAVCVCLVLQRFQYLISAEWDRGFVRACFHWNKTKKKKSLDIGDTLNRTLFSAVSMSGNKFYFRPWKRFIYTKLQCFLLPKLF